MRGRPVVENMPDPARWLREQGIGGVSLNPDPVVGARRYLGGEG